MFTFKEILFRTKFASRTEKAAHNMMLLAIAPFGMFCIWQLWMMLAGMTSVASWTSVALWGAIAISYGVLARLLMSRNHAGWFAAVIFLVLFPWAISNVLVGDDAFYGLFLCGGVNLYLLILLLADRRNYFAAIKKTGE